MPFAQGAYPVSKILRAPPPPRPTHPEAAMNLRDPCVQNVSVRALAHAGGATLSSTSLNPNRFIDPEIYLAGSQRRKKTMVSESDIMSMDHELQYGLIYSSKNRTWSRWHVLQFQNNIHEPYKITGPLSDLYVLADTPNKEFTKLSKAAVTFAFPIAARIYLHYELETEYGTKVFEYRMSGFWLEEKYFITCAHCFPRDLFPDKTSRTRLFTVMTSGDVDKPKCVVTTSQTAEDHIKEVTDPVRVTLLNADIDADIAIFCRDDMGSSGSNDSGLMCAGLQDPITIEDLHALPPTEQPPIFSVAYPALKGPGVKEGSASWKPVTQNRLELSSSVDTKNLGPSHSKEPLKGAGSYNFKNFNVICENYLDKVLPNSQKFKELKQDIDQVKESKLSFEETFTINTKSFAAGTIQENAVDEERAKEAQHEYPPSVLMNIRRHDMTTWFGTSGGLVGIVTEEGKSKYRARIIGLVKGSNTRILSTNSFLSFTEAGIAWINEVIHATEAAKPEDFGSDDFMMRRRAVQQAQQAQ